MGNIERKKIMRLTPILQDLDSIIHRYMTFELQASDDMDHSRMIDLLEMSACPLTHYTFYRYIRAIMLNYNYNKHANSAVYHGVYEVGKFIVEHDAILFDDFNALITKFDKFIMLHGGTRRNDTSIFVVSMNN